MCDQLKSKGVQIVRKKKKEASGYSHPLLQTPIAEPVCVFIYQPCMHIIPTSLDCQLSRSNLLLLLTTRVHLSLLGLLFLMLVRDQGLLANC